MSLVLSLFASAFLTVLTTVAAVPTLTVNLEASKWDSLNIYELPNDKIKSQTGLAQLKYFETQKKWKDCSQKAGKIISSHSDLTGWILVTWMNCAMKQAETETKIDKVLKAPLQKVADNIHFLDRGPWKNSLVSLWQKAMSQALASDSQLLNQALNWAALRPELLNYELRNQWFEKNQNWTAGVSPSEVFLKAGNINVIDAESDLNQRLDSQWSLKKKDQDLSLPTEYLKKYPSGKFYKVWRDRWIESYKQDNFESLKRLSEVEPSRLLDMAQIFHRRSFYKESLFLAKIILEKGQRNSAVFSIAGRSSLFVGQYEESLKFFNELIEKYSGTEEASEALFRSGLLYFRLKKYAEAKVQFEKLMASGRDKTELNTKYWLYRSLQALKAPEAEDLRDQLIVEFRYAYYGLKVNAEKNEGKVIFEAKPGASIPTKIVLKGESVNSWKRVQTLLKNGWWSEAQSEISEWAWTQNPYFQVSWAQWLAKNRLWPTAIRLVNQAFELNPDLKNWHVMQKFFPADYIRLIQTEAEKRKIHPRLVQSLIRQESAFGLRAVSTSNALGLMQMIPPTAQEVAKQLRLSVQIPEDMYLPQINIPMGTYYIAQMVDEFKGQVPLALASYNAGPTRMKIWLSLRDETKKLMDSISTQFEDEIWMDELPWSETSFYVKAILRNIVLYELIEGKELTLRPAFWSDLIVKNAQNP